MANERTWQFLINAPMDNTSSTTNWKNMIWHIKAFLMGQLGGQYTDAAVSPFGVLRGFWTCYYSCDGTTAGTAGDGIDRWGTIGSTVGSGSAASVNSGATIPGAVRISGLSGMVVGSVGRYLTLASAASAGNNSKTNTPWVIVQYNSASSVDVLNPDAVPGDANNGSISWTECNPPTRSDAHIVGNTNGNAHSWMVLRSPGAMGNGPWYLILDVNSTTTGTMSWVLTRLPPTGGSTTARPTSTQEVKQSGWENQALYSSGQCRVHMAINTLGDFYFISSQDGGGIRSTTIIQALADYKGTDLNPVCGFSVGNGNTTSLGNLQASVLAMLEFNGTMVHNPVVTQYMVRGVNHMFALMTGADLTDSAYDDLPAYVYQRTPGHRSMRGRLVDFRWCPSSLNNGEHAPAAGTPDSMVIGDLWFPTNAAPTL